MAMRIHIFEPHTDTRYSSSNVFFLGWMWYGTLNLPAVKCCDLRTLSVRKQGSKLESSSTTQGCREKRFYSKSLQRRSNQDQRHTKSVFRFTKKVKREEKIQET